MNHHHSLGPYHDLLRSMRNGNPQLEYLYEFMSERHGRWFPCRIAVLDFGAQSNTAPQRVESYTWPRRHHKQDLYEFLDGFRSDDSRRRLFIVEDLIPDAIEALGCRFSISPSFFAGHLRITEKSDDTVKDRSNVPRLPSMCNPYEQFHLKY